MHAAESLTWSEPSVITVRPLVDALERGWAAIRALHPDTPEAVLVIGPGDDNPKALKLGHWSPGRWVVPAEGRRAEVLISGESLQWGAAEIFNTLLHEAAHGIAWKRKVQDTSRQGRYHNREYKKIAEEVGLVVKKDPGLGWAITEIPSATVLRYAEAITDLQDAIDANKKAHRRGRGAVEVEAEEEGESEGDGGAEGDEGTKPSTLRVCACGRKLRVAPAVYELGLIMCGVCARPFLGVEEATLPPVGGQAAAGTAGGSRP